MTTQTQPAHQSGDTYVIARSPEEAERLRAQSRLLEEPTRQVLDAVRLAEGMVCLDAGCGPGEVMRMIGERVGATGHVVGLDVDGELGCRAAQQLNETGLSRFEFIEGDLLQTDAIEPNTFSLTFARLLMIHLHDPVTALRRMWDWTRPGGYIAVIDFDLSTIGAFPPIEAVNEVRTIGSGVFERAGLDPRIGSNLPYLFGEAGIGPPDGARAEALFKPAHEIASLVKATYESFLPAALKLGVTTEARSQAFFAGWDAAVAAAPPAAYGMGPLVVGAWKHKPFV